MILSRLNRVWLAGLFCFAAAAGACQSPALSGSADADTAPTTAQPSEPTPPTNVVFILVDDLGWADLGYAGSSFYQTPNIDRLAASGMVFTDAYAACPVCSPTRASIMTGKTPARTETTDWFGAPQYDDVADMIRRGVDNRWTRLPLIGPNYTPHLAHEEHTLPEAFSDAGYATFFAGKWHLGGEGFEPTTHGFDINIAGFHRGGPYGGGKYFHPFTGMPNLNSEPGDHLPARLAEETADFITAHKDEPFFAYLSFYSVHTPLMGRPDLVQRYEELKTRMRIAGPIFGPEGDRQVRLVQEHAVYAAMVTAMDEAVGHVLDTLEAQGLDDNTIVVFFADNGGLSTSEGSPTSNLPLRAGKGWLYEGGIREPCIVRWPGHTQAGDTSAYPILSTDFYPTLLAMCGLDPLPQQHVDGINLAPSMNPYRSSQGPARPLFWHYPHYGNQGGSPGSAVRAGDWKLIRFYEPGKNAELYNLRDDIGEQHNLAESNPDKLAELNALLDAYLEETDAKLPVGNPNAP
ncbi:MAG: sulfatase [Phycisphaerales bacterium JB063]